MQTDHEWVYVFRIENGDISAILVCKDSWQFLKKLLWFFREKKMILL